MRCYGSFNGIVLNRKYWTRCFRRSNRRKSDCFYSFNPWDSNKVCLKLQHIIKTDKHYSCNTSTLILIHICQLTLLFCHWNNLQIKFIIIKWRFYLHMIHAFSFHVYMINFICKFCWWQNKKAQVGEYGHKSYS